MKGRSLVVLVFACTIVAMLALPSRGALAAGPAASAQGTPAAPPPVLACISVGARATVTRVATGQGQAGCTTLAGVSVSAPASTSPSGTQGTIITAAGSVGNGDGRNLGQQPFSLTYANGALFISDWNTYNVVRRLDLATHRETVVAGNGGNGFNGDGLATMTELSYPSGVVAGMGGNVFIAEADNQRVRRLGTDGQLVTVAGGGTSQASGVPGTAEYLGSPSALAVDAAGNVLIADWTTNRVLRFDVGTGMISVLAGTGSFGYNGDNQPAGAATLSLPDGVAVDKAGNVFIADEVNQRIRKIDAVTGIITTVAGTGIGGFSGDGGPATAAQIFNPAELGIDGAGDLYFVDVNNGRVREVDTGGVITTVAGGGTTTPADGVPALSARFNLPYYGVTVAPDGTFFIGDTNGSHVWQVSRSGPAAGLIDSVAGNGTWGESGDGDVAAAAQISQADNVAFDSHGNYYVADWVFSVVRKVSTDGTITTVAGLLGGNQYSPDAYRGYNGDGMPATTAMLHSPAGMAVDSQGNLFIADSYSNRVRMVDTQGVIHTVAGTGTAGYSGDNGAATQAELDNPNGVALDSHGNLFIADTGSSSLGVGTGGGNRIREVSPQGIITTVAGTGIGGYTADGVPAAASELNGPSGVAVDSADNVYVADTFNSRVRRIDMHAVVPLISTVAGTGTAGTGGDGGPAAAAQLGSPTGVSVDAISDIAIADASGASQRVRVVDPSGVIRTVAGNGRGGYGGDGGPGAAALLDYPGGVAYDTAGNLFIADGTYPYGNNRVREVFAANAPQVPESPWVPLLLVAGAAAAPPARRLRGEWLGGSLRRARRRRRGLR